METLESSRRSRIFAPASVMPSDRDATEMARLVTLLTAAKQDSVKTICARNEGGGENAAFSNKRSTLIAVAKESLILRRARCQFLDESIFGEPGWDMLLALYISEETEARNSIARLTEFSGVGSASALRWIAHLERLGCVRQIPHPDNLQAWFIELTDDARHDFDGYFSRVIAMGLAK